MCQMLHSCLYGSGAFALAPRVGDMRRNVFLEGLDRPPVGAAVRRDRRNKRLALALLRPRDSSILGFQRFLIKCRLLLTAIGNTTRKWDKPLQKARQKQLTYVGECVANNKQESFRLLLPLRAETWSWHPPTRASALAMRSCEKLLISPHTPHPTMPTRASVDITGIPAADVHWDLWPGFSSTLTNSSHWTSLNSQSLFPEKDIQTPSLHYYRLHRLVALP